MDPYAALTQALQEKIDSPEQTKALVALRPWLEQQPAALPQLCPMLVKTVAAGEDSLFKRWALELYAFALGSSTIASDARTTSTCAYALLHLFDLG